jgi:putative hemolysin
MFATFCCSFKVLCTKTQQYRPVITTQVPVTTRRPLYPAGKTQLASAVHPAPVTIPSSSAELGTFGKYRARLAQSAADRDAACRLRFNVFNLELGEGLLASYATGLDQDKFDAVCEHLIVEDAAQGIIVGTYRMQSGATAAQNFGYYSEQEFCFQSYQPIRSQVLELGRASIDSNHRSSEVLTLLWRSITQYARMHGLRYLIGCSSLNSQNPQEGWAMYHRIESFLVSSAFRTHATPQYQLPEPDQAAACEVKIPKLLRTYIGVGARICSAPAWDREFGTIDFLTLLDLEDMTPAAKARFLVDTQ